MSGVAVAAFFFVVGMAIGAAVAVAVYELRAVGRDHDADGE